MKADTYITDGPGRLVVAATVGAPDDPELALDSESLLSLWTALQTMPTRIAMMTSPTRHVQYVRTLRVLRRKTTGLLWSEAGRQLYGGGGGGGGRPLQQGQWC